MNVATYIDSAQEVCLNTRDGGYFDVCGINRRPVTVVVIDGGFVPKQIGNMTLHAIPELLNLRIPSPQEVLLGIDFNEVRKNLSWLYPLHYDPYLNEIVMSVRAWLIRTKHHNILIDCCFGNQKERPNSPAGHRLDTPWLDRLAALGLSPTDIHFVTCTHLHADHVGWNTRLLDGRWVPTFPNAKYLFGRLEFQDCESKSRSDSELGGQEGVFADSILPCVEADLAQLVDHNFAIEDGIIMQDAPGHTVGNMIINVSSLAESAIFSGDVMHSPLQMVCPDSNSIFCGLPQEAISTRLNILEDCADNNRLLVSAHFAGQGYGVVRRNDSAFRLHEI